MKQPVNQHWVPQFYLREFATQETRKTKHPQVWIFSKNKEDGLEKITNVRNICAKRYLYSPLKTSEMRDFQTENRLSDLESLLAKIWDKVAWGFVNLADSNIRKGLSLFIATMYLRHPTNLTTEKRMHARIVDALDKTHTKTDGTPNIGSIIYKSEKYALDTSDWKSYKDWDENEHCVLFTQLILEEASNIADILLKKRWSVVFSDREQFITSDKPVSIQHQSPKPLPFGINTAGAIVIFPLSPTRILIMDDLHQEPCNQYYPLTKESIGAFNFEIWNMATRFMITGRNIHDVFDEVTRWAKSNGHI